MTVSLVGGRSFIGTIDRTSDEQRLRLRFGNDATTIVRSLTWSSITSASVAGRTLGVAELRQLAAAEPNRPSTDDVAGPQRLVLPHHTKTPATVGGLQLWRVPGRDAMPLPPESIVRSIAVDAYPANWDSDVDTDGLLVTVSALDESGRAVPVDGTLEVELVGETLPPYTRGEAFPVLGRWSRQITSPPPAALGGIYRERLPFQFAHPDYQLDFPRYSLLHVRLVVPGQGTFEASLDGLSLRGFTPVRDRLQAASGARLLPNEQSGRGKRLSSRELR